MARGEAGARDASPAWACCTPGAGAARERSRVGEGGAHLLVGPPAGPLPDDATRALHGKRVGGDDRGGSRLGLGGVAAAEARKGK